MKTREEVTARINDILADIDAPESVDMHAALDAELRTLRCYFRLSTEESFIDWAVNRVAQNDYLLSQPLAPAQLLRVHTENSALEWMLS